MNTLAATEPEPEKQGTTFDQASREATGARPYGRYLEDFEEGATYKHWPAKTVTEADDHLFCLITMNHHPLHINDEYARQSQQGRNVVVGPLVYSLALGMTVFLVFPFTRLVHVWSAPIWYVGRRGYQVVRTTRARGTLGTEWPQ